jgi:hypothetical protein
MRAKAYLNLRYTVQERAAAFSKGLEAAGFEVVRGITHNPSPDDIFVTWSRIGAADEAADAFIAKGNKVLVAENASWGNSFAGKHWYTIARTYHNQAGRFPIGGPERWDSLGIVLQPWRTSGETVILPQRGIGPVPVAMPRGWGANFEGRVRKHPGRLAEHISLEEDLANCGKVITWGSGAAIKAIMWGIPVESHMPSWIGEQDNTDEGRLAMFRRLAHAQWTLQEISEGLPFHRLLGIE